ncbi:unnamed protein product [Amoebophrya sp. A25]|nr:unnamed protein product [Amoebophrya sp. A25]|eukprot:GSA25T00024405001.1
MSSPSPRLSVEYLTQIGLSTCASSTRASSSTARMPETGGEPAVPNGGGAAASAVVGAVPGGGNTKAGKKNKKGEKKQMIDLAPPHGTRDFFPEEMRSQKWLFDKFSGTAKRFGFELYDAPVLENVALYERKAGEEITEQMYNFIDKDGASVTLRPEMTPSLARMVLNLMREETGQMSAILPLKWYSIPQCWRFETTQRGRKREHYQWNMDMIGVENITAEAELLAAVVDFFESVGLTSEDIKIKVNSRKVLGFVLAKAGVSDEQFAAATVIIDKQDKIGAAECKKQLNECLGLAPDTCDRIVDATAAETIERFAEIAEATESEEVRELQELFSFAKDGGWVDWLVFDASVVRGLAYYTGIVFEANDRKGEFRAICGGGRYDRLLSLYGATKPIPMVGFGFGDCVIMELLKERGLLPKIGQQTEYLVCAFNKDMMGPAMSVARELRKAGKTVLFYQQVAKKIGNAFSYADRVGAQYVALVAPGEWEKGEVRIKDLHEEDKDKKEKDVKFDDLKNL